MGLSAGGLVGGGACNMWVEKKASETADIRQNENLCLKNEENVSYSSSVYSLN